MKSGRARSQQPGTVGFNHFFIALVWSRCQECQNITIKDTEEQSWAWVWSKGNADIGVRWFLLIDLNYFFFGYIVCPKKGLFVILYQRTSSISDPTPQCRVTYFADIKLNGSYKPFFLICPRSLPPLMWHHDSWDYEDYDSLEHEEQNSQRLSTLSSRIAYAPNRKECFKQMWNCSGGPPSDHHPSIFTPGSNLIASQHYTITLLKISFYL